MAIDQTDQPRDGADERRVLLSLSDDSLHIIFSHLPLPDVAALAGTCTHTCAISCAENLWQRLAQARWPGVAAAEGGRWRALHRERAALPRWQYLWCCMDAIERLLTERPAPVLTRACACTHTHNMHMHTYMYMCMRMHLHMCMRMHLHM